MKSIFLAIWITVVVLSVLHRVAQEETIECDINYFIFKTMNLCIWCGFIYWYS